jgi:propanol-preferring alcohol dehydrogenase
MTDCHAGERIVFSGPGGLGRLAIQYAGAMRLQVAVVGIVDEKFDLSRSLGASCIVNAALVDPSEIMQDTIPAAPAVQVTAISVSAFYHASGMVRRGGTWVLTGVPSGLFPLSIFDTVLRCLTVRGSLTGTRADMNEALAFAAAGKVRASIELAELNNVYAIQDVVRNGTLKGGAVSGTGYD